MNFPLSRPATFPDNKSNANRTAVLAMLLIVAICALPLFGHLTEAPIQVWDEMRNAQNALEMRRSGNPIVTCFDGAPETWNTKPPLMIWVLALSMKIFGNTELGVRLPSAMAGLLTSLLIAAFLKRRLGTWIPGVIAVIVLMTSGGYVAMHGTRTGDFDALLTLFTTAAVCSFVLFMDEGKKRFLWIAALSLTGAVLTKGVAGLFIGPSLLLYGLFTNRSRLPTNGRTLLYCAAAFVMLVGGYYGLREIMQPGYLKLVWENELGGRYNTAIESHRGDRWMYLTELRSSGFSSWMRYVIPVLAVVPFFKAEARRTALISILVILTVGLFLSMSATKIRWYIIPIYPFLAILYGLSCYWIWDTMRKRLPLNRLLLGAIAVAGLVLISIKPYSRILAITIGGKFYKPPPVIDDSIVYLQQVAAGDRKLAGNVLCTHDAYHLYFYRQVLRDRGLIIDEAKPDALRPGMRVIIWEDDLKAALAEQYSLELVDSFRSVSVYRLNAN